ncbi:LysR substrate-binding domain-containing protein [Micromonospora parathelypteridis]|uniref:DNA-binding transcriptional LysR family regulator n=1 Tax=Micromonospora parathelypteridis TaxID=1839617 RepID=A0A840VUD9_9ACTN|nr:LysR family transcriptional regulator [Micromonospora parathelypteridis]MBB5476180.1 DNA-binding transcriptional LysR family regulator [Micromonospora parathelypteridis]GGO13812.1 LysR family transcriptional regulator [Micromonospora parathelypteridis]
MELRDIEIFLALAEELHFGRTAERLRITPARVSQSIKKQERRVGAALFDRTTRTVRLTPLGVHLNQQLSAGYRQITEAIEDAAAAAGTVTGVLRLGCMGAQAWTINAVLDRFRARHPAADLRLREIHPTAPLDELRSGDVDVALVWLPLHEPDLTVGPVVHTSNILLAMSAGHTLAARESVCLEDLGDCTVVDLPALPRSMEEVFHPLHTPSGRSIPRGPTVTSWHEILSTVAAGKVVSGSAGEAISFYPWPGIVYVPIRDAPSCRWALVWRTANETPAVRALAAAVDST